MFFLQIIDDRKNKNIIHEKCIASVSRFVTERDTYVIKEVKYNQDTSVMINEIDKIRFSYAKEYDDLLYVDPDCFLSALPTDEQLEQQKIIMGESTFDNKMMVDVFLFYVNGQKDFFLKNYETLIQKRNDFLLLRQQLQLFAEKSAPYEPLAYFHYGLLSLEMDINRQFNLLSNRLIETEKEVDSYRYAIQGMVTMAELYNKLREKQGK